MYIYYYSGLQSTVYTRVQVKRCVASVNPIFEAKNTTF